MEFQDLSECQNVDQQEIVIQTRLSAQPLEPVLLPEALAGGLGTVGAVVNFTGMVRDFAKTGKLVAMEIEHYPGMTESVLQKMAVKAAARWALKGIVLDHRIGRVEANEPIVALAVTAVHRADAFEAAQWLMDCLKVEAPFWKKEIGVSEANWVEAKSSDLQAFKRWL